MKNVPVRLVSALLAATLLIPMFAGCSKKSSLEKGTKSSSSVSSGIISGGSNMVSNASGVSAANSGGSKAQGGGGTQASTGNFNPTGLPIVKKSVTIKVLTVRPKIWGNGFKNDNWIKNLEATTNVKVDWDVEDSANWGNQKPLLLASGKLPDVFLGDATLGNTDIVTNLSLFRSMDSYINQYMPNLKSAMQQYSKLKKISTYPDGKIYALPSLTPNKVSVINQPIINKVWLKNVGMKEPTNINELENVLMAFKLKDPNKNGVPDEVPYTSSGIDVSFLSPFGITDYYGTNFIVQNNKPVFWPTTTQMKNAMKWMHKLYSEGLIDSEMFTEGSTKVNAKFQNASAPLVGFSYQWTTDAVFGKWTSQYEAIAPIAGPDGNRYSCSDPDTIAYKEDELEVTKSCKYPEVVARWADQWYTGEASIQNFWGGIGQQIQKNNDGTYTVLVPPAGQSADNWYWTNSLREYGPKFCSDDFSKKIKFASTSGGDGQKQVIQKLGQAYVVKQFGHVVYSASEYQQIPVLQTDLFNYIKQMEAKWITQGGVDSDWNGYVQQLNDMGLDKYVKIHVDGFNRYDK